MTNKPRFTLKAILVIITVLSMPSGMMSSGIATLVVLGVLIVLPIVGGCIGYVAAGWTGVGLGVPIGCVIVLLLAAYVFFWAVLSSDLLIDA